MGDVTLYTLAITGLIVLLITALARIRDEMLNRGFLDADSRLGKTLRAGQRQAIRPYLEAVGYTEEHFDRLRASADSAASRRRAQAIKTRERPDVELAKVVKPWIVTLGGSASYGDLDRYVDTMGAVHHQPPGTTSLSELLDVWVGILQAHRRVAGFDCVLTVKDGNPVLVREFCHRRSAAETKPILCKGQVDRSRVRTDHGSHETEFEGLRAFLAQRGRPKHPQERYSVLAMDDNCTSGTSLLAAIRRFNDFIGAHPHDYPFKPVDTAVVLFVSGKADAFDDSDVALHALLSLGAEEMKALQQAKERQLAGLVANWKTHPACRFARTLPDLTASPPADGAASSQAGVADADA